MGEGEVRNREREAERSAEEWVEAGGDAAIGIAFEGLPPVLSLESRKDFFHAGVAWNMQSLHGK